jgi:ParB-like chromosome segregation protein Spo0J
MLKQDGLWVPLLVDQDGILLVGHHRYQVPKELANLKRRQLNNQIGIKVNQRNC